MIQEGHFVPENPLSSNALYVGVRILKPHMMLDGAGFNVHDPGKDDFSDIFIAEQSKTGAEE
jgi:methanogenic corrinoid protein MtbC1